MPSKSIAIPGSRAPVEPFQHPGPKLVMAPPDMQPWKITPPSMSPLHMSPPNMELPNFSPIQDHMPLPTLSASTFIPPQSFLTHELSEPTSVIRFCGNDPTVLAIGSSQEDPDEAAPVESGASVAIMRVEDVEREVRGDSKMIARGVYDVRVKVRPRMTEMSVIRTPSGVLDLAFSPHEPDLLLATLATGVLIAYRVDRGSYSIQELSRNDISPGTPLHTITFSPVSRNIAAATAANGFVFLLKIPKSPSTDNAIKPLQTIQAHSAPCLRAAFSADGRRLYTAGEDGVLTSWSVTNPANPKQRWTSTDEHSRGITALQAWPAPFACDVGKKRRLLLTGSYDGQLRIFDMSMQNRPPFLRQEMDLGGPIWKLAPLPPLPMLSEIDDLGAGAFTPEMHPDVELDPDHVGLLAASWGGGARVLIHKQKFEEVFLPRRDGSGIVDWTTNDGVKMDHEGREKQYWWYDLADIEEHGDSPVYACDAVAIVDYDPLFKDAGKQRLRRGWRLCSVSRDGTLCFWQVYVE